MPTRSELENALRNADKAGDTAAATRLAQAIRDLDYFQPKGGSIADPIGQGAMLGFSDEISGALGAIPAAISTGDWDLGTHYAGIRDAARANQAAYSARNPGTALAAEIGGGLMTGGAGGARLAGLKGAKLVAGSGLLGSAYGGLSGAGHSEESTAGDAAKGALLGGATGMLFPAAGQALAKAKRAASSAMRPSNNYTNAVRVLQNEGIPLTGGQVRGSNWQKVVEDQLADTPLIGTNLQRVQEGQRQQFQRGLLRKLGVDDSDGLIDINHVDDILDSLSNEYGKALRGKVVNIADDSFLDDLGRIESKHTQFIDDRSKAKIRSIVNSFLDEAEKGGKKTGEWYQQQRSLFAKRAQGSSETAGLYGDLVEALDNAFERIAPKVKGDIDKRWAQAMQLKRAAQGGGADVSEGLLPLASLNRAAKTKPGNQDWRDYINSGAMVLPSRVGNSGTATRQMANDFVRGGLLTGLGFTNPWTIPAMLAARRLSTNMSRGGGLDVTRLLPGGGILSDPRLAQGLAANAGLLQ